jgi:hypothetical protein
MKLILLFGPQAVGKMTIGQELEKVTGLKLFHNHMTIELVSPFFNYGGKEGKRLVNLFRREIFKAVAKSDLAGLIFTYVWYFDEKADWDYVDNICKIFKAQGADIYFVELESDIDVRIKRNKHPHRLKHKPTKKDISKSEENLRDSTENHRVNSAVGEIKYKNYLRINNTKLKPDEVAKMIKKKFKL